MIFLEEDLSVYHQYVSEFLVINTIINNYFISKCIEFTFDLKGKLHY